MYWAATTVRVRASAPPPPPVVEVAPVVQRTVPVIGEWVGTTEGYVNAQIQPQVSGYLIRQDYREGAYVKKGRVLFEIDPRPFQAALDQAKGQLAQEEAQVANADLNVKRDIPEAEAHAIPMSQLESDTQSFSVSQPVFQAGALRSGLKLSRAQWQEAVLSYQQTVQNALEQVSNALIASQKNREFREQQDLLTQAAQRSDQLSQVLYQHGGASYLQVLTNETNYFSAEVNLVQAQLSETPGTRAALPGSRRRMAAVVAK